MGVSLPMAIGSVIDEKMSRPVDEFITFKTSEWTSEDGKYVCIKQLEKFTPLSNVIVLHADNDKEKKIIERSCSVTFTISSDNKVTATALTQPSCDLVYQFIMDVAESEFNSEMINRINAKTSVNDDVTNSTDTWSSQKINDELNTVDESLNNKLDKNQGTSNSGKYLSVGSDGNIVPVDAPSGGSGTSYVLPVATADTLGGVKPVTKTTAMTQQVGVDSSGLLWTAPSSGSSDTSVSYDDSTGNLTINSVSKVTYDETTGDLQIGG